MPELASVLGRLFQRSFRLFAGQRALTLVGVDGGVAVTDDLAQHRPALVRPLAVVEDHVAESGGENQVADHRPDYVPAKYLGDGFAGLFRYFCLDDTANLRPQR